MNNGYEIVKKKNYSVNYMICMRERQTNHWFVVYNKNNCHLFKRVNKLSYNLNVHFINKKKLVAWINCLKLNYHLQFPELDGNVFGEENDTIKNNKGQDVTIKVGKTIEETLQCLSEALDDDLESAKSLAEAAHKEFTLKDLNVDSYPIEKEETIDLKKIGIWIDPIGNIN